MKSAMPYLGLTSPELRTVLRPVLAREVPLLASADEWRAAILDLWDDAVHREERYAALAIAEHKAARRWRAEGALDLYRFLIESGAWWDLVDEIATHLVRDELLDHPARVADEMRRWATDCDLWVRRTSIICQVGAKQRTDQALLSDVIVPNLEGAATAGQSGRQDFFVRKAIGWALRDHARTDPDWVREFVDRHAASMSGLSMREAMKHLA